jgi:hypothetical protein
MKRACMACWPVNAARLRRCRAWLVCWVLLLGGAVAHAASATHDAIHLVVAEMLAEATVGFAAPPYAIAPGGPEGAWRSVALPHAPFMPGLQSGNARLRQGDAYQQVADKLASLKIAYSMAVALKPVESLPADVLQEMLKMKNGDAFVIAKGGGVAFMQITGVEEQPATLDQARPAIAALLRTQDIAEAMQAELARLH